MQTLRRWHEITTAHIANIHMHLFWAIAKYITTSTDPLLKDTILLEYNKFYSLQTTKMNAAIESIFKDEKIPFTLNKYYYDAITKMRKEKAEKAQQELIAQIQVLGVSAVEAVKPETSNVNRNEELAVEELQERLLSYCKVARKRIVDVVLLQSIERHMVNEIDLYIDMLISVDENTISTPS